MPIQIEADEVDEFVGAVAGLEVEYVRTDAGVGPCRTVCAGSDDTMFSSASMGFSAIARTSIPDNLAVFLLVTAPARRAAMCGVDLDVGQLHFYGPGMPFVGIEPVGLAASVLVVPTKSIGCTAELLETGDPGMAWSAGPLPETPAVERLKGFLDEVARRPELMDDARSVETVTELAAGALSADLERRWAPAPTRIDSGKIVRDAIEFVDRTKTFQPTMSELCRAACASESRVRRAFIEILDAPPSEYFKYRLLNKLRDELLLADPTLDSVTRIASSLGVTQLGRTAGRYRALFDELPRDTLRLRPTRHRSRSARRTRPGSRRF